MNCIDVRVIEYWAKARAFLEWQRDSSLEVEVTAASEENPPSCASGTAESSE